MTGIGLRQWRESHGMTQQQLADCLKVRRATIADWERETRGRKLLDSALLDLALAELGRSLATATRSAEPEPPDE